MLQSNRGKIMKQDLIYKELHFDGKKWSEESLEIMEDMLEVWDSGHRIIICHPNKVFLNKFLNNILLLIIKI